MKEVTVKEIELFAFWGYNLFPYIVGSVVTKMAEDGAVYAPRYQGWFRPSFLLPVSAGKKLDEQLRELQVQQSAAMDAERNKWDEQLSKLVPPPLKKLIPKR